MAVITIKIERTERAAGNPGIRHRRRRAVAALGAAGLLLGGVLAASSAQAVGVVSIPPKALLTNFALGAHMTVAVTVLGGSTTVPTDATRVVLSATVTNTTAAGNVFAYPQGNQGGASGDTLPYTTGQSAFGALTEPVGTGNRVRLVNQGAAAIRLSVSLIGYSTEVRVGDISPAGGTAGQVLTNTSTGAAWQPTQPGAHAFGAFNDTSTTNLGAQATTVASLNVPAGSYVVTFTTTVANAGSRPSTAVCTTTAPSQGGNIGVSEGADVDGNFGDSVITTQGFLSSTSGGTITVTCEDIQDTTTLFAGHTELIADSVGAVTDQIGNTPAHHHRVIGVLRLPHQATR
jgi:hypothetical protein